MVAENKNQMQYTKFGNSGLQISKVIVGTMRFGTKGWLNLSVETNEERVMEILKYCYDSGLRTFDTSCNYSNGQSEILLGKFLKKYNINRERVVIMTKCFYGVVPEDPYFSFMTQDKYPEVELLNLNGLSRKSIFDSVSQSVERLGTYIDVLQIHRYDHTTPAEETMKALHDVVQQGQARYLGASTMKATEFAQLQFIAEKNGWTKFVSMQNYYHLLYREEEREMIPFCKKTGVALIPWSPNGSGTLTRPYSELAEKIKREPTIAALGMGSLKEGDIEIINRVEEMAKKKGVSMAAVSSAWVLSKGSYPIVGLTSEERVDDIITALSVKFTDEELRYLEEPYYPKSVLGYLR